MPSKSRHNRKRYLPKQRKQFAAVAQQPQTAPAAKPAAPDRKEASVVRPANQTKPQVSSYPYIKGELIRIAILTSIILIILVTLALVLT